MLLFAKAIYSESIPEFSKKMPGFNDIRNEVVKDIFGIWQAAGLLIISYSRIQTKFNDVVAKFEGTKKWAKVH